MVAIALFLGSASVWPEEGMPSIGALLAHSAIILVSLVVFFLMLPRWFTQPIQILVGMIGGVAVGWILGRVGMAQLVSDYLGIFGTLFILLLKMVIVPLVFVSIVCGVAGIGDVRRLGSLGVKTLVFYFCTTGIAVLVGLICVNALKPGIGQEHVRQEETAADEEVALSTGMKIQQKVLPEFVHNPIMAQQPILAVIFFALLLGAALASDAEKTAPALRFFQAMDHAMVTLVLWIMLLAPMGVFALMGNAIATMGLDYIASLAKYVFTVVFGLMLHFALLVFVILPLLGRISPMRYLRGMAPALQLAFSTSSSSATLPVTIDCASRRVGVSRHVCSFMLPVGATINMDGTALYQAVAALFIAQVYGIHLGVHEQFMVFMTAVVVSVGTAGIPGASVGLMSIVLSAVGLPLEGIGIVIGVDRFLDMCRTVVNITGDSVGAVVVGRSEGELGEPETGAS